MTLSAATDEDDFFRQRQQQQQQRHCRDEAAAAAANERCIGLLMAAEATMRQMRASVITRTADVIYRHTTTHTRPFYWGFP